MSLTVRQLWGCYRALIADARSLTHRAAGGDGYATSDHLLFMLLDQLRVANWQRTGKKGNKPKPAAPLARKGDVKYGRSERSPTETQAMLARYGPRDPSGDEMRARVDQQWIDSNLALAEGKKRPRGR